MPTRPDIDSPRALANITACNVLGTFALYLSPYIVAAIVDGFDAAQGTAGIVSSWELGAMAAASMLVAARFRTLEMGRWLQVGLIAFLAGSAFSAACMKTDHWHLFILARGATGAGAGVLLAISSGLAARRSQPDRAFAFLAGAQVAVSGMAFWAFAVLTEWVGPCGVFVGTLGTGLLAAPLLGWVPAPPRSREAGVAHAMQTPGRVAVVLVCAIGCFSLAINLLYPYTELIGLSIGLSLEVIAHTLAASSWLSILGPIAAGILGTRVGRTLPIGFGTASQIGGGLLVVYASSHWLWLGANVFSWITLQFYLPILNALVAAYDPTGRVNAEAASATAWASAAGPLLAGLVLNVGGSYASLGWLMAIFLVAQLALVFRPSRAADRRR